MNPVIALYVIGLLIWFIVTGRAENTVSAIIEAKEPKVTGTSKTQETSVPPPPGSVYG